MEWHARNAVEHLQFVDAAAEGVSSNKAAAHPGDNRSSVSLLHATRFLSSRVVSWPPVDDGNAVDKQQDICPSPIPALHPKLIRRQEIVVVDVVVIKSA